MVTLSWSCSNKVSEQFCGTPLKYVLLAENLVVDHDGAAERGGGAEGVPGPGPRHLRLHIPADHVQDQGPESLARFLHGGARNEAAEKVGFPRDEVLALLPRVCQ